MLGTPIRYRLSDLPYCVVPPRRLGGCGPTPSKRCIVDPRWGFILKSPTFERACCLPRTHAECSARPYATDSQIYHTAWCLVVDIDVRSNTCESLHGMPHLLQGLFSVSGPDRVIVEALMFWRCNVAVLERSRFGMFFSVFIFLTGYVVTSSPLSTMLLHIAMSFSK